MTKRRFGERLALTSTISAATMIVLTMIVLTTPAVFAQQEEIPSTPGKPIRVGEVLSGELNAMRTRDAKSGKKVDTYQITSEPRRLPPPHEFCNLVTGPQTFQLVTNGDAQIAQLKSFVGKAISVRVGEISCANDPGQISEAVIAKWSLVKKP